jgi:ribosomal protein S18 acetylase RimI-like enzyme
MDIRKLHPEDASPFQALRLRGLLEAPPAFGSSYAEEVGTPVSTVADRLAAKPDGAVFGAFHGTELVGVIGIQRERLRQLAHKATIWGMYVSPEHRRSGIGRALMSHVLGVAATDLRVLRVNLTVNTTNTAAISLYESMGFRTFGTEVGVLMVNGHLHDEHLMALVVVPANISLQADRER